MGRPLAIAAVNRQFERKQNSGDVALKLRNKVRKALTVNHSSSYVQKWQI